MRKKRFAVLIGVFLLLALGTMALAQPGAGAVQDATKDRVEVQLLFELPENSDGRPTSLSDLLNKISNIGA